MLTDLGGLTENIPLQSNCANSGGQSAGHKAASPRISFDWPLIELPRFQRPRRFLLPSRKRFVGFMEKPCICFSKVGPNTPKAGGFEGIFFGQANIIKTVPALPHPPPANAPLSGHQTPGSFEFGRRGVGPPSRRCSSCSRSFDATFVSTAPARAPESRAPWQHQMGVGVKNRVTQKRVALVNGLQGHFNLRSDSWWYNFDPYPNCLQGRCHLLAGSIGRQ